MPPGIVDEECLQSLVAHPSANSREALTNINIERQRTPPWGLFGGEGGATAKALVRQSPDDPGAWLTKKPNYPLKEGGSVMFFTAGGGGYGPTSERAPELLERDRRLGYVPETPV